jgi:hypothetical protein
MSTGEVGAILRAIGQLEGKLDATVAEVARYSRGASTSERRITALEVQMGRIVGWAAGAGVAAGATVSGLTHILS